MFRSFIFTTAFYLLNIVLCVACIPVIVMPRKQAFDFIHFYVLCIYWLEKHVLGLDYEVRGREHLPTHGPYIIAAKHQSAYETFKLHLLWRDPAVILKRELIRVPLWGKFLARSEPIAIDRGNIRASLRQLTDGARKVRDQGRVLVIYPQGTRVAPGAGAAENPYRIGVQQAREASAMPIIPMALNSGLFWPRKGLKKPGIVTFEFLPPVPERFDRKAIMNDLETRLEQASARLAQEAQTPPSPPLGRGLLVSAFIITLMLSAGYWYAWTYAAGLIRAQIDNLYADAATAGVTIEGAPPSITGFPGPHHVHFSGTIRQDETTLTLPSLDIKGLFLPGRRIAISMPQGFSVTGTNVPAQTSLDMLSIRAIIPAEIPGALDGPALAAWQQTGGQIVIDSLQLRKQTLVIKGSGTLMLDDRLQPSGEGNVRVSGYPDFVAWLQTQGMVSDKNARMAGFILQGLSQTDGKDNEPYLRTALTLKNRHVYIGPLQVFTLPEFEWSPVSPQASHNPPAPPR